MAVISIVKATPRKFVVVSGGFLYMTDGCDYYCESNPAEICGGIWRISIYDTWHCATKPCKNGAACMDIDAGNYSCVCTDEWTGRHCENVISSTTKQSSSSQTRVQMSTDTEGGIGSKQDTTIKTPTNMEDQCNKSATIIALLVVLALLGIVTVVLAVVVIKNRSSKRQQKNDDQTRVYCEPDESGMTGASRQLNTLPDINTPVQQNATKEQRCKPRTCNVTRQRNTPAMVNSDMKISDGTYVNNEGAKLPACTDDDSYELLQHNKASDREYTTIGSRNTRLDIGQKDVNYEMLNKNSLQSLEEDEYRKLNF